MWLGMVVSWHRSWVGLRMNGDQFLTYPEIKDSFMVCAMKIWTFLHGLSDCK